MAVTLEQVRNLLESDEPKYSAAAKMGAALLPHLQSIVTSPDEDTASKAAYLASLVNDPRAAQVMQAAARHRSPLVRLAVAAAARTTRVPNAASAVASLTRDRDTGVRKAAGKSARGGSGTAELEYEDAPVGTHTYYVDALWLPRGGSAWQTLEQLRPFNSTKDRAEMFRSTLQLKWQNRARGKHGTLLVRCLVFDRSRKRWLDCRSVY